LRLLGSQEVGRLAVSVAYHPDIFPINYVVDDATIVFRTAEGTKLAAAFIGHAVAFEADGYDADTGDAWSVVVKGHAEEIAMHDMLEDTAFPVFPWSAGPKSRFMRVVPDEISGRGIGGALVAAAVDHANAEGLTIVPWCPFARHWLRAHPEEAAAMTIDWKPRPRQ
jgi:GNAT superfamily N-acetyltransferase